jgi:hypothetical protein
VTPARGPRSRRSARPPGRREPADRATGTTDAGACARHLADGDQRLHERRSDRPTSRGWAGRRGCAPPPGDRPGAVRRRDTAVADGHGESVAFGSPRASASAVVTSRCSFVLPEFQGRASARDRRRILPADGHGPATATDSAQPISQRLVRPHGIVRGCPLLNLTGLPPRPEAFGRCRRASPRSPFDEIVGGRAETAGIAQAPRRASMRSTRAARRHPSGRPRCSSGREPSRLAVPRAGRARRSATATPARPAASGRSRAGRALSPDPGPRDRGVVPRGRLRDVDRRAGGPGARAGAAAGFRLDAFPVLLCWDRPFADFIALPARSRRAALTRGRHRQVRCGVAPPSVCRPGRGW